MYHKKHPAVTVLILALVFTAAGSLLYVTALSSFRDFVVSRTTMTVTLGSPVYSYDQWMEQPGEGALKASEVMPPLIGSKYGVLYCKRINLKVPVYYGDSEEILLKGAGQYVNGNFPGKGQSILIGGHDASYFAPLEHIKNGDVIHFDTTYGRFEYKVYKSQVVDTLTFDLSNLKAKEELNLYTCYPFGDAAGAGADRFMVYAKKVAGPVIVEGENEE